MGNDRQAPDDGPFGTERKPQTDPAGGEVDEQGERVDFDEFDDFAGIDENATGPSSALPPKVEAWRRRSAAGAILTGFALGLQEALEKRKEEPAIVMETSGDPPRDLPVEADFEYGRPRQSVVQIRPWLLPDGGTPAGENEAGEDGGIEEVEPDGPHGDQP